MAGKKNEQADRVTILIDDDVNSKIQSQLAKTILEIAKDFENSPPTSYSRVLNIAIEEAFAKGIDKKILKEAASSAKE